MILRACASVDTTFVPNDWDFDGDSFDKGDLEKYLEYKQKQERERERELEEEIWEY